MDDITICNIQKNNIETIQVVLTEYNGKRLFKILVICKTKGKEFIKKCIAMPIDKVPELIESLTSNKQVIIDYTKGKE